MITDEILATLAAAETLLRNIHTALYALDTDRGDTVADEFDEALTEVLLATDLVRSNAAEAAALLGASTP